MSREITLNYNNELFVLDNANSHMNHNKDYCTAHLKICDRNAVIQTQMRPVLYCKTCGRYYISPVNLKQINERGVPLVKINTGKHGVGNLREESPLKLMGYNVSQKEGLNPKQRRFILKYILDKRYMPKERVLSYLRFFLKNPIAGETARGKWMDDIRYVESLA